jgi:hypothetical protein
VDRQHEHAEHPVGAVDERKPLLLGERDRRDAGFAQRLGGGALAAVAATLVFAPQLQPQYAAWLLPWTALAFESDDADQRTAIVASVAIALTGVIAIAWGDPATEPSAWVKVVVLARNLALIGVLASWLAGRGPAIPDADAEAAAVAA